MSNTENLNNKAAIVKLKSLVEDIQVCFFCTNLKTEDGSTCQPMTAIKVCNQGNIWFFSDKNSHKNKTIATDNKVQLFFSHPGKSRYLIVNGDAEIIFDERKIDQLWTPIAEMWFKKGMNDPSISILKVQPTSSYYWNTDNNQMMNFMEMVEAIAAGTYQISSRETAYSY